MARRRQSGMIDDIFTMLAELPWGVGVGTGVVFWVMGVTLPQRFAATSTTQAMAPFLRMMFFLFAVVSLLAAGVSAIRSSNRRRLLDRQRGVDSIRDLSWREFEQLVGEAYRRQGYVVEEIGGGGPDGGVDLLMHGREGAVVVQCKQWKARQVGVDKVRELFGVMTADNASRGILITSGSFTRDALSFAEGKAIDLVDGHALVKLVRNVQSPVQSAVSDDEDARPDSVSATPDCPVCGSKMILRTARRGKNAGAEFYGCSCYPSCKGTMRV